MAFNLQVVTPEREIYNGAVSSVQCPGVMGSFGVLTGHAPLVAALEAGLVRIEDADRRDLRLFVGGGFFQIKDNQAMLLADSAEFGSEISIQAAREAEERALSQLSGKFEGAVAQRAEAEEELKRARARLRVASGG